MKKPMVILCVMAIGFMVMVIVPPVKAEGIDEYTKLMLHGDTYIPSFFGSTPSHYHPSMVQ